MRVVVVNIRIAGINDGKVSNEDKESSDRKKYQAKTAKSKKPHQKPKVFRAPTPLFYF